MQGFILARVVQAVVTLLILSLAVFLSVKLTGDPAAYMLGPDQGRMEYEQIMEQLGLNRPLHVQYWDFLTDILRLDFGKSHFLERSAREVLLERLPATLQLAGAAFGLALIVGIPLGVMSAVKRDSWLDNFGKLFAVMGIATPNFWVAIMLILLFGPATWGPLGRSPGSGWSASTARGRSLPPNWTSDPTEELSPTCRRRYWNARCFTRTTRTSSRT